ncbi:MAG: HAD family hydrolase [Verrucomicrobiae bacterium]|nr:HAD family hydrolase [Verrucomicrobiae bacterium]
MKKNSVRLFVFDFDGTALGGHIPYEQFPKPFVRFLDRLAAKGIRWGTNTTWGVKEQLLLLQRSGVKNAPAFLIGSSGRIMATVRHWHLIPDRRNDEAVKKLDLQLMRRMRLPIKKAMLRLLEENLVERISFNEFGHHYLSFQCAKKNGVSRAWAIVRPLLASGNFYCWEEGGMRGVLLPHYMNKGHALKVWQKRLGISPDETLVAGDGPNDPHMFSPEVARWMVCPSNADPKIKKLVHAGGGAIARKKYSWGVLEGIKALGISI